ncbi:unnamed protein product [Paramecium octaurelia]|uniref:Uncharacterized protein n=1 Tax=Paramecium octaurelia TaxID=43137 RepID=A0A8S1XP66_PAROT|nr:unnamed protein product [Paramecium octaurelia]
MTSFLLTFEINQSSFSQISIFQFQNTINNGITTDLRGEKNSKKFNDILLNDLLFFRQVLVSSHVYDGHIILFETTSYQFPSKLFPIFLIFINRKQQRTSEYISLKNITLQIQLLPNQNHLMKLKPHLNPICNKILFSINQILKV